VSPRSRTSTGTRRRLPPCSRRSSGEAPDLVVFRGDLTWGSLPHETLALVRSLDTPTRFVCGNADRALRELRDGEVEQPTARELWKFAHHLEEDFAFLAGFAETVSVVDGLGATCLCHGSPRSDEECVTGRTPAERVREFMAGRDEKVVVTAHVHAQYDRTVDSVRLLCPGSVGLPYEDGLCAYRAMLGPEVELRRTEYDVEAAVALMRATDDPSIKQIVEPMLTPPSPAEVIAHAELRVFAG
jgi:predicted phosphodiesterase